MPALLMAQTVLADRDTCSRSPPVLQLLSQLPAWPHQQSAVQVLYVMTHQKTEARHWVIAQAGHALIKGQAGREVV